MRLGNGGDFKLIRLCVMVLVIALIVAAVSFIFGTNKRVAPSDEPTTMPSVSSFEVKTNLPNLSSSYAGYVLKPGQRLVSPFNGQVVDRFVTSKLGMTFGIGTELVAIRTEAGDLFTFVLPFSTPVYVNMGDEVKVGQDIATYVGGEIGGKTAGYQVLVLYEDAKGNRIPLPDLATWA